MAVKTDHHYDFLIFLAIYTLFFLAYLFFLLPKSRKSKPGDLDVPDLQKQRIDTIPEGIKLNQAEIPKLPPFKVSV